MTLTAGRHTEEGTSRFIKAGGIQLHYHEAGQGEPLICLDAFGPGISGWATYHRNLEGLAEHYRVILVDMPGRGHSDPAIRTEVPEPGHAVLARYVLALMDELGIEKAPMIGNAVGGTTVVTLAISNPERVTKMVIAGCSASTGGNVFLFNPVSMEGIRLNTEASRNLTRENVRRYLNLVVFDNSLVSDDLVDHMYETALRQQARATPPAQSVPHNNLEDLPKLQHPILMFHGRYDPVVTLETAVQMVGLLPNSRLVVMRCGNLVPFEFPDEFNRITLDFLKHA